MFLALTIFLAVAVIEDFARRRICNILNFGAALVALLLHFHINGFGGVLNGLGGLGVGFAVFLPFYLLGGMGAGDVKAMAAAGAFLAPLPALLAAGLSLLAGAVLGLAWLAWLAWRGGLSVTLGGYGRGLVQLATTGRWQRPAATATAAAMRFPYALAIASGTLAAAIWTGTR